MTQVKHGFKAPPAEKMPILCCVGTIGNIESTYVKETGNFVTPITISPIGAGKEKKVWLTIDPEWMDFGFTPPDDQLKAYTRTVNSGNGEDATDGLALLQALAGSPEGYADLCNELVDTLSSLDPSNSTEYAEALNGVLTTFVEKNKPVLGYVLKQQTKPVKDEVTGETTWTRTKFYDVDRWFYPTEKQIEKEIKSAEKSQAKYEKVMEAIASGEVDEDGNKPSLPTLFKVTFDTDVPF